MLHPEKQTFPSKNTLLRDCLVLALVITSIWMLIWSQSHGLNNLSSLPLPNWRDGDTPSVFAWLKAYGDHSSTDFALKFNQFLNAPFIANWNDTPGDDLTFPIAGLFTNIFGLFLGANLYILSIHVLSGISSLTVALLLGYRRCWSIACAVIFAFAPVIFFRSLGHISVATIWYLPFILFSIVWLYRPEKFSISSKTAWTICIFTCLLSGLFNVYYAFLLIFFLGLNWLVKMFKGDRNSQSIALLLWLMLLCEILYRFNFFAFIWLEGFNPVAVSRSLQTILLTSITLPDLIFTPAHHDFYFSELLPFAKNYYRSIPENFVSETQLSYIGLTAAFGLILLTAQTIRYIYENQIAKISDWFWVALGVFVFSITGGITYLMGSFGFLFLRSNNRFAIFLMLIGLYFLCETLSQKKTSKYTWVFALGLAVFGVWDQVPSQSSIFPYLQAGNLPSPQQFKSFTENLEKNLPTKAMVFQLPVHAFPESGMQNEMGDYEQLMPYIFSKQLHFSFGGFKGRSDSVWQRELAKLSLQEQLKHLESYGFTAVLIHKNAYSDRGAELMTRIKSLGYALIAENDVLAAYRLNPAPSPISPAPAWEIETSPLLTKPKETISEFGYWSKLPVGAIEIKQPWYLRMDSQTKFKSGDLKLGFYSPQPCTLNVAFNQEPPVVIKLSGKGVEQITLKPNLNGANVLAYQSDCPQSSLPKDQMHEDVYKLIKKGELKDEPVFFKLIQYVQ